MNFNSFFLTSCKYYSTIHDVHVAEDLYIYIPTNFSFRAIYYNYIFNIFSNRLVFKNSTYEK